MRTVTIRRQHRGFTLIELLVVMAVIGALVALLLPAVQQAREAARRAQCKNHLKQIGLALHNYESTFGTLPIGARSHTSTSPTGTSFGFSWWVGILPYIDQATIYNQFNFEVVNCGGGTSSNGAVVDGVVIPVMRCPSSPLPSTHTVPGGRTLTVPSFVGIAGAAPNASDLFPPASCCSACCFTTPTNGLIAGNGTLIPNAVVRLGDLKDGTSNTIAVGETSNWAVDSAGNQKRIDGAYPNGWMAGTTARGTPPNYSQSPLPFPFRSWNLTTVRYSPGSTYSQPGVGDNNGANNPLHSAHEGGVHALVADGSARFISENIDLLTLKRLAIRGDGEAIDPY